MPHYTKEKLESFRRGQLSIPGRILCAAHLKNCQECSALLKELEEEENFIRELMHSIDLFQELSPENKSLSTLK